MGNGNNGCYIEWYFGNNQQRDLSNSGFHCRFKAMELRVSKQYTADIGERQPKLSGYCPYNVSKLETSVGSLQQI